MHPGRGGVCTRGGYLHAGMGDACDGEGVYLLPGMAGGVSGGAGWVCTQRRGECAAGWVRRVDLLPGVGMGGGGVGGEGGSAPRDGACARGCRWGGWVRSQGWGTRVGGAVVGDESVFAPPPRDGGRDHACVGEEGVPAPRDGEGVGGGGLLAKRVYLHAGMLRVWVGVGGSVYLRPGLLCGGGVWVSGVYLQAGMEPVHACVGEEGVSAARDGFVCWLEGIFFHPGLGCGCWCCACGCRCARGCAGGRCTRRRCEGACARWQG